MTSVRVFWRVSVLTILTVGLNVFQFGLVPDWHVEERELNYYDVASSSHKLADPIGSISGEGGVTSLLGVPVYDLSGGLGQRMPNAQGVNFSGWILWRAFFNAELLHLVAISVSGLLVALAMFQQFRNGMRSHPLLLLFGFLCLHWNSLFALRETDYATVVSSFHASACLILFVIRCEISSPSQSDSTLEPRQNLDILPIAFSISISSAHYGFVIPAALFILAYAVFRPRRFMAGLTSLGGLGWLALVPAVVSLGIFLLEWPTFSRYAGVSRVVSSLPPISISNLKHIVKQLISDDFLILRSVGGSLVQLDDIVTTGSAAIGSGFIMQIAFVGLCLIKGLDFGKETLQLVAKLLTLWVASLLFSIAVWLLSLREPLESLISTYESILHVPALLAAIGGILLLDRFMSTSKAKEVSHTSMRARAHVTVQLAMLSLVVVPAFFTVSRDGGHTLYRDHYQLVDLIARVGEDPRFLKHQKRLLLLDEDLYFQWRGVPATSAVFRDHGLFPVSLSSKLRQSVSGTRSTIVVGPNRRPGDCLESGLQFLQVEIAVSSSRRAESCLRYWRIAGLRPEVFGDPILSDSGKQFITIVGFNGVSEFWSAKTEDSNKPMCDLLDACIESLGAYPEESELGSRLRVRSEKDGMRYRMPLSTKGELLILPLRWDSAVSLISSDDGSELVSVEKDGLLAVPASEAEFRRGQEIQTLIHPDLNMWLTAVAPWAWWFGLFLWLIAQWRDGLRRSEQRDMSSLSQTTDDQVS